MFEGYYAEHVIRNWERERTQARAQSRQVESRQVESRQVESRQVESRQVESRMMRGAHPGEERAVLSADWRGWSWQRARAVLGTLAVALVASAALPASLQAIAWGLREILELVIH